MDDIFKLRWKPPADAAVELYDLQLLADLASTRGGLISQPYGCAQERAYQLERFRRLEERGLVRIGNSVFLPTGIAGPIISITHAGRAAALDRSS